MTNFDTTYTVSLKNLFLRVKANVSPDEKNSLTDLYKAEGGNTSAYSPAYNALFVREKGNKDAVTPIDEMYALACAYLRNHSSKVLALYNRYYDWIAFTAVEVHPQKVEMLFPLSYMRKVSVGLNGEYHNGLCSRTSFKSIIIKQLAILAQGNEHLSEVETSLYRQYNNALKKYNDKVEKYRAIATIDTDEKLSNSGKSVDEHLTYLCTLREGDTSIRHQYERMQDVVKALNDYYKSAKMDKSVDASVLPALVEAGETWIDRKSAEAAE